MQIYNSLEDWKIYNFLKTYLDKQGFQLKQLSGNLDCTSCCKVHWLRFITSGASYILIMPSTEHVANCRPKFLGPNLTSVTDVLESTKLVLRTQCLVPRSPGPGNSPTTNKNWIKNN